MMVTRKGDYHHASLIFAARCCGRYPSACPGLAVKAALGRVFWRPSSFGRCPSGAGRTARLADEHCEKYAKTAVPVEAKMPGLLFGIIQEIFDCE
jgi:hypothetical protein